MTVSIYIAGECRSHAFGPFKLRSLLQAAPPLPLPQDLTVGSFSNFSTSQLLNVSHAAAAAASAVGTASAAVAATYHISEL